MQRFNACFSLSDRKKLCVTVGLDFGQTEISILYIQMELITCPHSQRENDWISSLQYS